MRERAGLIIQADPLIRQRWCAQLERHHVRSTGVPSLQQGLAELARTSHWEVVILDETVAQDPMAEPLLSLNATPTPTRVAVIVVVDLMQPQSLVDAYYREILLVPHSLLDSTLDELVRSLPSQPGRRRILRAQTATRSVLFRGEIRHLSTGEWRILRYLAAGQGRWRSSYQVSREALSRDDATGVPLVWKYVSTLKRKLSFMPGVVESAPRRGYRLCPALSVVFMGDGEAVADPTHGEDVARC